MKPILLSILFCLFSGAVFSQRTDFIVIKKRNNRTLKTYYPGIFISAVTHNGFTINGYITAIRNDSIYLQQQELQLVPTDFGSTIDTVKYTIGFDYHQISRFNFTSRYKWGGKRGFVNVALPKILMIGGVGYVVLELVNTAYRKESLNENNKLPGMGIALGIAAAGFAWEKIRDSQNKVGGKYKVVYVKQDNK